MARMLIFRIDDAGGYHLVAASETLEEALAEATHEQTKDPWNEYRVLNPNIGVVEVIPAVRNFPASERDRRA